MTSKKSKDIPSGSVKIFPDIHKKAVEHCSENGVKISYFVTEAVKEKLEKEIQKQK